MEPKAIVLEVEASLAWLQAGQLALLQLKTIIDGGYAVHANGDLILTEMMTLPRSKALVDAPAATESYHVLRSIIRSNMEMRS